MRPKKYRVPFGEFRATGRTRELVNHALDRGWVSGGELVDRFEVEFAKTFGFKYAAAMSSGTAAVLAAVLAARGVHEAAWRGGKVVVPALCFPAPVNAVIAAGLTPVFVDVDRRTLNVEQWLVDFRGLTGLPQVVVHTMGRPARLHPRAAAFSVEDCCEAHGASAGGAPVGRDTAAAAFSFYAAHLICSGEGGMVGTNDVRVLSVLRSVRSHGRPPGSLAFDFQRFGLNLKMNDLEAAVGLAELEQFGQTFARRSELLAAFRRRLAPLRGYFYLYDSDPPGRVTAPHAVPLVVREDAPFTRDELFAWLEGRGVQCKTLFGCLPVAHGAFQKYGHAPGDFPEAEFVGENGLHFGCHQYLEDADVDYVAGAVEEFVRSRVGTL